MNIKETLESQEVEIAKQEEEIARLQIEFDLTMIQVKKRIRELEDEIIRQHPIRGLYIKMMRCFDKTESIFKGV